MRRVLADVAQGGGDKYVVEGEEVGGFTWDEFASIGAGDRGSLVIRFGDHAVQNGGCLIAEFLVINFYAGERWLSGLTDKFVIPHSHHRDVIWAAQAQSGGRFDHKRRGDVGVGKNAHRKIKLFQCLLDEADSAAPVVGISHHHIGHVFFIPFKDATRFARLFENLSEGSGPAMRGLEAFRTEVSKMVQVQTDQMLGGKLGDLGIVPEYNRGFGVFVEPASGVDDDDTGFFQPGGIEDAVFSAERDDAVTGPGRIEGDRARAEVEVAVHFELPVSHVAGKVDDALENLGGITGA